MSTNLIKQTLLALTLLTYLFLGVNMLVDNKANNDSLGISLIMMISSYLGISNDNSNSK